MKTFLKILLCVIAAIVVLKLMPFILAPVLAVGFALVAATIAVAGGVLAFAGAGLTAIVALLAAAVVVLAVLSPLWLPVLAIVGVVALICRLARTS